MKKIYKYELKITSKQSLRLPADYSILAVAEQNGKLCAWICVNPDLPATKMLNLHIFGTDHPIDQDMNLLHIDTILMTSGLVWHIFQED